MVAVEHQRSISKEENEPNDEEPRQRYWKRVHRQEIDEKCG